MCVQGRGCRAGVYKTCRDIRWNPKCRVFSESQTWFHFLGTISRVLLEIWLILRRTCPCCPFRKAMIESHLSAKHLQLESLTPIPQVEAAGLEVYVFSRYPSAPFDLSSFTSPFSLLMSFCCHHQLYVLPLFCNFPPSPDLQCQIG